MTARGAVARGPGPGSPPDPAAVLAAARPLIAMALAEDLGAAGDITSNLTLPAEAISEARLVAREKGVLAGLDIARAVFLELDPEISFRASARDGDRLAAGQEVARVTGSTRALLSAERTALNFLQRLSGVATQASRYVDALHGTSVQLLDTRKTIPGWRALEKYAVAMGGGRNHRQGLFDMILIKDNHELAAGGVGAAAALALARRPAGMAIEVEVRSPSEVAEALAHQVDGLLFDNMSPEIVGESLALVERTVAGGEARRPWIEISGGITLETIADFALPGVDFISVGAVTHSAPALDLALDLETRT